MMGSMSARKENSVKEISDDFTCLGGHSKGGVEVAWSYDRFAISVTQVVIYFETSSCERLTCR